MNDIVQILNIKKSFWSSTTKDPNTKSGGDNTGALAVKTKEGKLEDVYREFLFRINIRN